MKQQEYTLDYVRCIIHRMIGSSGQLSGRCLRVGSRVILLPINYAPLPRELVLAIVRNIRKDYGGILA